MHTPVTIHTHTPGSMHLVFRPSKTIFSLITFLIGQLRNISRPCASTTRSHCVRKHDVTIVIQHLTGIQTDDGAKPGHAGRATQSR